jgi:hypothetical protein
MDPNAALDEIRAIVTRIQNGTAHDLDSDRLAELFAGLDDWIKSGGFLPTAWRQSA